MLSNSITARIVLLVIAVVCAGQLILGLGLVRDQRTRALADGRAQLDLAERVVIARVAQARAQAQALAHQLARNPILLRAQASQLNDVVFAQVLSAVRKLGNARGMLVRVNGQVLADLAPPDAIAPVRSGYWVGKLAPAFASGQASGFVSTGGTTAMWTAVPSGFDPTLALVLVQGIEDALAAEFARSTLSARVVLLDQPSDQALAATGADSRRVFVDATDATPVAVELRVPASDTASALQVSLRQWLPIFLVIDLLSALAAFALCRKSLQPLDRLRRAIAGQTADNLQPLDVGVARGAVASLTMALNGLIEQIRERDQSLTRRAYRDPLTSLPNGALLHERLTLALREARKTHRTLAILLIDIQRFDVISDSLGPVVADAIVATVAARLKSALREADNLLEIPGGRESNSALARVAGDRFAIVLPGCNVAQAEQVADRVTQVFRRPIEHERQEIDCRIAIGVAVFPHHAEDAAGVIRAADIALRWARRVGEPVRSFSPEQEREREFQTSMAIDLQKAMVNGSLALHFQPKIALGAGPRPMAEALIRWSHPERGLVDPREFVPFAERMGLIGRLSRWVIDQALAQVVKWRSSDVSVQLAINVSLHDLSSPHFATHVIERIRHHGLPADALTIEVSESALAQPSSDVLECLQVLDRFGVKLGIDDFGAGYAALAYLRTLPVDHVKIDRRFVLQMATDQSAHLVVSAAIRLAHSLQWQAVAEGVENAATMQMLRELDCDHVQGYYLGKPLAAEDYLAWHRHQSRRFDVEVDTDLGEPNPSVASQASSAPGTLIRI